MKEVELFENGRAAGYDDLISIWMPHYAYLMELLPGILAKENHTGNHTLLAVGCGTGNEILAVLKSGDNWRVTGVDPSPDMISIAHQKLSGYKNQLLIEGNVENLPAHQRFGAATLILVLHSLPDDGTKLSLLKSISSRLESKAPLVLVDIFGDSGSMKRNLNILKNMLPVALDPTVVHQRPEHIENEIHHLKEERLIELLMEAGFEKPHLFHQSAIYGGWIAKKK